MYRYFTSFVQFHTPKAHISVIFRDDHVETRDGKHILIPATRADHRKKQSGFCSPWRGVSRHLNSMSRGGGGTTGTLSKFRPPSATERRDNARDDGCGTKAEQTPPRAIHVEKANKNVRSVRKGSRGDECKRASLS